ncbi:hypothetical protein [Streptomyces thermolineatus]
MEPTSALSAGGSIVRAAGMLKSRTGTRLGSREERREVYSRFQSAVVAMIGLAEHMRFQQFRYPWVMSSRAVNRLEELRRSHQVELLQAYMELRLVANPGPMTVADEVLSRLQLLMEYTGRKEERQYDAALDALAEAQRRFVDSCRDDLWYLPRWWQAWRPAWWSSKWKNLRRRQAVSPSQHQRPS